MVLTMEKIFSGYGKNIVIRGISIQVKQGEILTILGHNGAGKTTTLKPIMGLLRPYRGEMRFQGNPKTYWHPRENVVKGISYLPQGMALMTRPRLLLMDEPSLGLAPLLVENLMETVRTINKSFGTAVLLVEQNVK